MTSKRYTISLTDKQASIILKALENESNGDVTTFGEYSYWRCYLDIEKKLDKEGFWKD